MDFAKMKSNDKKMKSSKKMDPHDSVSIQLFYYTPHPKNKNRVLLNFPSH